MPRVSVIIPCYNYGKYVGSAVESVLSQTYRDFEVIVVDDGSTDDTPARLEHYLDQITYVRQENGGLPAARNTGIDRATGEFVALLDADDLWVPNKLQEQIEWLQSHPEVSVLHTDYWYLYPDGHCIRYRKKTLSGIPLMRAILMGNDVDCTTSIVRTDALRAVNGFDPSLRSAEDADLWLRMLLNGNEFGALRKPLAYYRQHGTNMTRNPDLIRDGEIAVRSRFFGDPRVPAQILGERGLVYSRIYVSAAARALLQNDFEKAVANLAEGVAACAGYAATRSTLRGLSWALYDALPEGVDIANSSRDASLVELYANAFDRAGLHFAGSLRRRVAKAELLYRFHQLCSSWRLTQARALLREVFRSAPESCLSGRMLICIIKCILGVHLATSLRNAGRALRPRKG